MAILASSLIFVPLHSLADRQFRVSLSLPGFFPDGFVKVSAQVNPFVSWDLLWFLCPFQWASGPSSWGTRFRLEGHWVPQSGAQPRAVPDQPCVLESRDVHSQWPSGSCGIFVRRECISSHQEHLARSWCFTGKATKMNYTYVFRFSDVAGDRRERQRVGVLL